MSIFRRGQDVYRVELSYECTGDAIAVCNVKDGTVYQGGLLCNGEHLYSALGYTSYDFWLYEPTEELTVTIDYSGQEKLTTGNLRIVETNLLWTKISCDPCGSSTVGSCDHVAGASGGGKRQK